MFLEKQGSIIMTKVLSHYKYHATGACSLRSDNDLNMNRVTELIDDDWRELLIYSFVPGGHTLAWSVQGRKPVRPFTWHCTMSILHKVEYHKYLLLVYEAINGYATVQGIYTAYFIKFTL